MAPAVAKKVNGVVITSSPGPMSRAISGSSRASEPEAQPIPCMEPQYSAISASSAETSGPSTNIWLSRTWRTTGSISSRIVWYCALRFRAGILTDSYGTLIGGHSFDASGSALDCACVRNALRAAFRGISLLEKIGWRTLVLRSNRVNVDRSHRPFRNDRTDRALNGHRAASKLSALIGCGVAAGHGRAPARRSAATSASSKGWGPSGGPSWNSTPGWSRPRLSRAAVRSRSRWTPAERKYGTMRTRVAPRATHRLSSGRDVGLGQLEEAGLDDRIVPPRRDPRGQLVQVVVGRLLPAAVGDQEDGGSIRRSPAQISRFPSELRSRSASSMPLGSSSG